MKTIRTIEELDGLPKGSIIATRSQSHSPLVLQRTDDGWAVEFLDEEWSVESLEDFLPAIKLFPSDDTPTPDPAGAWIWVAQYSDEHQPSIQGIYATELEALRASNRVKTSAHAMFVEYGADIPTIMGKL